MPAKPGPLRPHEERRNLAREISRPPPPGEPQLGDSFLLVTEGAVTEKLYFDSVRKELQLTVAKVKVIHPNCTDAEGLVRAAMGSYEKDRDGRRIAKDLSGVADVRYYDHVWVLFDTDVPARQKQLEAAMKLAKTENIHLGHSTPSVELWLLLHFRDRPGPLLDSNAAEHAVGEAWAQHYEKSTEGFRKLWPALKPKIPLAVTRADQVREYHRNGGASFPPNPSTELDLLVRALNASVQPPLRIIP